MKYPQYVNEIIERLEAHGHSAYAVGGCVRDLLLGRIPNDFDVTTSALPEETLRVFENEKTIPTGIKHGTVTVILPGGDPVEVTTYRIDGSYTDSRHPESVSFTDRIEDDLARRDFTVNAMAYNKRSGLVDPFDGRGDLCRRLLRAVGEPERRMQEDALRIMRAFRFSAQLGFTIDENTKKALTSQREGLINISGERTGVELAKLACAPYARDALCDMAECGVAKLIFGEYFPSESLLSALGGLGISPELRLACLLYDCDTAEARAILNRMKYSNALKGSVLNIIDTRNHPAPESDADVRRFLLRLTKDASPAAELMRALGRSDGLSEERLQRIRENGFCSSVSDLAIGGKDLLALGMSGKEVGEALSFLLDAVTEEPRLNNREKLIQLVKTKNYDNN